LLKNDEVKSILDVATGTGDLAIELAKLNPETITGIDIAVGMLEIGREKLKKKGLDKLITLEEGDAENLRFEDDSFDAVTVAFGVRNFETLQKGLREIYRVLKPGGRFVVLEFSKPKSFPFRQLYNFYFRFILPAMGKIISRSSSAYTYLPESVQGFAEDQIFLSELEKAGYRNASQNRLTMGIATIYHANK
jgi:demethylmenaquinone methyltransferase/2-methoxy-6-polyprenyl-1,4-benzoquinol methylase